MKYPETYIAQKATNGSLTCLIESHQDMSGFQCPKSPLTFRRGALAEWPGFFDALGTLDDSLPGATMYAYRCQSEPPKPWPKSARHSAELVAIRLTLRPLHPIS